MNASSQLTPLEALSTTSCPIFATLLQIQQRQAFEVSNRVDTFPLSDFITAVDAEKRKGVCHDSDSRSRLWRTACRVQPNNGGNSLPASGLSGAPPELHLAGIRHSSAFSKAQRISRFLDAESRRQLVPRDRRTQEAHYAGGSEVDLWRLSPQLIRSRGLLQKAAACS